MIHEAGHYAAGKLLKFKINEFSIGFGPKILQKRLKNGELFSLRAVPLGGYCAFAGEGETFTEAQTKAGADGEIFADAPAPANKTDSDGGEIFADAPANKTAAKAAEGGLFVEQKPWKRLIVFFAGAGFNLISAVVFSFIFILVVGYASPSVDAVFTDAGGSPYCSLISGDEIIAVNGKKIGVTRSFEELTDKVKEGETVSLTVIRAGKEIAIDITKKPVTDAEGNGYVGFGIMTARGYKKAGFGQALASSVPFTAKMSWTILGVFGKLITGQIPLNNLSGPVGTVTQIADLSHQNWRNILILLPLIASNLAVFNLLPFPALDGSKMVFTAVEWARGKPVNRKIENMIHFVGIIAILGLVVTIDLISLFTR
jgi:regulator of sigma E protease